MTPEEIFEFLAKQEGPGVFTIKPGPFKIKIGDEDKHAGQLLNWMAAEFPNMTVGEATDVLQTALFWRMFWSRTAPSHPKPEALDVDDLAYRVINHLSGQGLAQDGERCVAILQAALWWEIMFASVPREEPA